LGGPSTPLPPCLIFFFIVLRGILFHFKGEAEVDGKGHGVRVIEVTGDEVGVFLVDTAGKDLGVDLLEMIDSVREGDDVSQFSLGVLGQVGERAGR
jgi:hypothetical protein